MNNDENIVTDNALVLYRVGSSHRSIRVGDWVKKSMVSGKKLVIAIKVTSTEYPEVLLGKNWVSLEGCTVFKGDGSNDVAFSPTRTIIPRRDFQI